MTPRTDAFLHQYVQSRESTMSLADFARSLERELWIRFQQADTRATSLLRRTAAYVSDTALNEEIQRLFESLGEPAPKRRSSPVARTSTIRDRRSDIPARGPNRKRGVDNFFGASS